MHEQVAMLRPIDIRKISPIRRWKARSIVSTGLRQLPDLTERGACVGGRRLFAQTCMSYRHSVLLVRVVFQYLLIDPARFFIPQFLVALRHMEQRVGDYGAVVFEFVDDGLVLLDGGVEIAVD